MPLIILNIIGFIVANWKVVVPIAAVLTVVLIIAYLSHERTVQQRENEQLQQEKQRLENQNAGKDILINANTRTAYEAERMRENSNILAINTNQALMNVNTVKQANLNTFGSNISEAQRRADEYFRNK